MTAAAAPDPREPKPCPRCGTVCVHDGWGHVHPNGIGIGSCPVPDPRFRDQLAKELAKHQGLVGARDPKQPATWFRWCICGWDGGPLAAGESSNDGRSYRAHLADVLAPLLEARVQAAANQRAAEELRAAAQWLREASLSDVPGPPAVWRHLDARAAALASPAPAPRAEEGQHVGSCRIFYAERRCTCIGRAR